jgi:hypothetical protein
MLGAYRRWKVLIPPTIISWFHYPSVAYATSKVSAVLSESRNQVIKYIMGNYLSKTCASNPSVYATPFNDNEVQTAEQAQETWKTYDYVIIGAGEFRNYRNYKKTYLTYIMCIGAAGCVLASRLSSNPDISVLLIEAGSR